MPGCMATGAARGAVSSPKLKKSSRMSVMAETHQSAMGPYVAVAAVGLALNSWTAVCREALVVKTQDDEDGGGGGGGGEDGGGGLGLGVDGLSDSGGWLGGGGEGDGGGGEGGEGVARGFWAQTEGLILKSSGLQKRPSAHVCCSGQQVEPSTGNFGWHVAEVGGGKMRGGQSTTQVRPLGGMLVDPQVPRAFGSQTVLR